jgi:hypothetical protein
MHNSTTDPYSKQLSHITERVRQCSADIPFKDGVVSVKKYIFLKGMRWGEHYNNFAFEIMKPKSASKRTLTCTSISLTSEAHFKDGCGEQANALLIYGGTQLTLIPTLLLHT